MNKKEMIYGGRERGREGEGERERDVQCTYIMNIDRMEYCSAIKKNEICDLQQRGWI